MKEMYTLDTAETLANDINNINLLLSSGSLTNKDVIEPLANEMQDKIEQLQTVLSFIRLAPFKDQETAVHQLAKINSH